MANLDIVKILLSKANTWSVDGTVSDLKYVYNHLATVGLAAGERFVVYRYSHRTNSLANKREETRKFTFHVLAGDNQKGVSGSVTGSWEELHNTLMKSEMV